MKAFILAAGIGSRLKPLTDDIPKALVKVNGKPMIEHLLEKLSKWGINKFMVNVHHHSNKLIDYLNSKIKQGFDIEISDESDILLDTGGAIVKAKSFFEGNENILIHNVDIMSDIDFAELEKFHKSNNCIVSLCCTERDSSRKLLFNNDILCGWHNLKTNEYKWSKNPDLFAEELAYSGIYLASPEFVEKINQKGKFSIIDTFLSIAADNKVMDFRHKADNWFDLGTREKIEMAEKSFDNHEEKFLQKVAVEIKLLSNQQLLKTLIILPNKRSMVFLKDYLVKIGGASFLPDIVDIDGFMQNISRFSKADPLKLFIELYDIYKSVLKGKARPLEDFISWAPMIISDFNDIDLHLQDAQSILTHLSEARAIKEWNIEGDLSPMQKAFIEFYQSLLPMYNQLHERMYKSKAAYTGFIYRFNAENIETLSSGLSYDNFILAGFGHLSPGEDKVFKYLFDNFNTKVFLKADNYFLNEDELKINKQEAGSGIKKIISNWGLTNVNYVGNRLVGDKINIDLYGLPADVLQAKQAAEIIVNLLDRGEKPEDIVVVLADENLLIPLLNSLPVKFNEQSLSYNITLGYPLAISAVKGFVSDWLEIIISYHADNRKLFNVRKIINLLLSNLVLLTLNESQKNSVYRLIAELNNTNSSFLESKDLQQLFKSFNLQDLSSHILITSSNAFEINFAISNFVNSLLDSEEGGKQSILTEQLKVFVNLCDRLSLNAAEILENIDLISFKKLLLSLISTYSVSLKGEPLSGIQIMGMLETRALDFKNLIILSANEGVLPKSSMADSFIPFDIRKYYSLPLPSDKHSVTAYHFYSLLSSAKNVSLLYSSKNEGLGAVEESRFIKQIEIELAALNKNICINEKKVVTAASLEDGSIEIEKSETVLKLLGKFAERGFSASALNTYITCGLKFCLNYIFKIRKEDELEESIEANTFGSIIHDSLEEIFTPFKGKYLDSEVLKENLKHIDTILLKYFEKHYNIRSINTGENLIIKEVSRRYLKDFIEFQIKELKENPVKIIGIEDSFNVSFDTSLHKVNLLGKFDRIDETADAIRIIDYKTGLVETRNINIKDLDLVFEKPDLSKAFQLLFYLYLFDSKSDKQKQVEAGIYSFRALNSGLMMLNYKEEYNELMTSFSEGLAKLIDQIFNAELSFSQTTDEKRCEYCDYKDICGR